MAEIRKMRTAEELYEYYCEVRKDIKPGTSDLDRKTLFMNPLEKYKRVENLLETDEYFLTTFRAYIYIYDTGYNSEKWIYILTNNRIMSICIDTYGAESIRWENIESVYITGTDVIIEADVYRMSMSRVFVRAMEDSEFIEKELEKVIPFIREVREKQLQKRNASVSPADEIRKFKQLWDDGIITAEEFQQKKKKLLDL